MTPTAAQMDGVVKKIQAMCAGRSDEHPQKPDPIDRCAFPQYDALYALCVARGTGI